MTKVSVIIANRNDTSMLCVTVRSCIEELKPLGRGNGEIIIVDNSDTEYFERLKSYLPTGYCRDGLLKIYRQDFPCLFTARELAAEKASGDYIFCLDSHVIVGRDCIHQLRDFMDRHSNDKTLGFAHAPVSWAHQHESAAKHDRDMSKHELGDWGLKHEKECTITWKGMPWMCRREWFLDKEKGLGGYGALSAHRISWGGGDMHIGIKPWLLGFKNWAIPTRPCIHIGPFPRIDLPNKRPEATVDKDHLSPWHKYRVWASSGNGPHAFGFLVSCYVLGGEAMMERNKAMIAEKFGTFVNVREHWENAKKLGKDEKAWLDARKVMSFEELLERRPWESGK